MKFIAYNKTTKQLVDGVVLSSEGNLYIARSSDKFNNMVNKWYKKQGHVLERDENAAINIKKFGLMASTFNAKVEQ